MEALFTPGTWVRLAGRPDWGIGQVQSAIGGLVTVNFAEAGKQVIDLSGAELVVADRRDDERG